MASACFRRIQDWDAIACRHRETDPGFNAITHRRTPPCLAANRRPVAPCPATFCARHASGALFPVARGGGNEALAASPTLARRWPVAGLSLAWRCPAWRYPGATPAPITRLASPYSRRAALVPSRLFALGGPGLQNLVSPVHGWLPPTADPGLRSLQCSVISLCSSSDPPARRQLWQTDATFLNPRTQHTRNGPRRIMLPFNLVCQGEASKVGLQEP